MFLLCSSIDWFVFRVVLDFVLILIKLNFQCSNMSDTWFIWNLFWHVYTNVFRETISLWSNNALGHRPVATLHMWLPWWLLHTVRSCCAERFRALRTTGPSKRSEARRYHKEKNPLFCPDPIVAIRLYCRLLCAWHDVMVDCWIGCYVATVGFDMVLETCFETRVGTYLSILLWGQYIEFQLRQIFYSLRDTPPAHQGEAACMR